MIDPKVSVIIPVYNTENYLGQCLDSVINQTLTDIEVICIDDQSTDFSLEILKQYQKKDNRITLIRQEKSNAGAARNKGLAVARGKYLFFLDSDDILNINALKECYNVLENEQSDVVVFSANQLDNRTGSVSYMPWSLKMENCPKKSPFAPQEMNNKLFNSFQSWPWNKMFRRSFVEKNEIRFQEITRTNDLYFVYMSLALARMISIIKEPLIQYRINTGTSLQATNNKDPLAYWNALLLLKNQLEDLKIYDIYKQGLVNNALSSTIIHMSRLKGSLGYLVILSKLLESGDQDFGFSSQPEAYYYDQVHYGEYKRLIGLYKKSKCNTVKPTLSVILPSLNVGAYICECIESVMSQTKEDIEIICVDAGSTDGTLEILREYEKLDRRIKVLISDKKSYGYQVNLGIKNSIGDYIGIVETDDWVDKDCFNSLYKEAADHNADIVRSNYYWYYTKPKVKDQFFDNLAKCKCGVVFSPKEKPEVFETTPSIWSGIYNRRFLEENKIKFNETPGASYQDASFHFMTCLAANRMYLIDKAYLHYRKDNDNSSVATGGKVFCICDEMSYFENYMGTCENIDNSFRENYMAWKYEKYRWNYERVSPESQWVFLAKIREEFLEHRRQGLLKESAFDKQAWLNLNRIIDSPFSYFRDTCKKYYTRARGDQIIPAELIIRSKIDSPDVSVIITAYNDQDCIAECINSVLNQTNYNIEAVCVDDGSTDNTLLIMKELANKDSRITVLHQINEGLSCARNTGMKFAKGRYIQFLDSDDTLRKDTAEKLTSISDEKKLDVLYFDGFAVYDSEELKHKYPYYLHAYEFNSNLPKVITGVEYFCIAREQKKYRPSACLAFYNRQYLNSIKLRFVEGIIHEDNPFTFVCMIKAKRVWHTEHQLYIRSVRSNSIITSKKTFTHLYGYLTSLIIISDYVKTMEYNDKFNQSVYDEIHSLAMNTRKTYFELNDKKCLDKLVSFERQELESLLGFSNMIPELSKKVDARLKRKIKNLLLKIKKKVSKCVPRKIKTFIKQRMK